MKSNTNKIKQFIVKELIPVILLAMILGYGTTFFVGLTKVYGESMEPTLQDQGQYLIQKQAYLWEEPQYEDIVVIEVPELVERYLIKRVIGKEGDLIEIKANELYRNGEKIKEPYILEKMDTEDLTVQVPKDSVFVMGDNRNNSIDGRELGCLPYENIYGKIIFEVNGFYHLKKLR